MNNAAMFKLSYGLFVLTAHQDGKDNGCITNTAIQVASQPNTISISVNKANYTHDMIRETGIFTVSVLSTEADFSIYKRFGFQSGRDVDKFLNFSDVKRLDNGILAITKGTNAYISGKVIQTVDLGSHTLFIAEITDMDVFADTPSVTYDYYHQNVKPKPEDTGKTSNGQTVWRCKICGYEYVGEEIPDDFICPLCKHPVSDFERITK